MFPPSQVNCYLTRSGAQVNSASKQLNNDNQLGADHDLIFEITQISGNPKILESLIFFVNINGTKSNQVEAIQ